MFDFDVIRSHTPRLRSLYFGFASLALLTASFCAAPSAAAAIPAVFVSQAQLMPTESARIIDVYRTKAPISFNGEPGREEGDTDLIWEPIAYQDAVHVDIEIADSSARYDEDHGVRTLVLLLDPETLTSAQNDALSQRRASKRIASFHLEYTQRSEAATQVDDARTVMCDSDALRCEDHIVYQQLFANIIEISVAS